MHAASVVQFSWENVTNACLHLLWNKNKPTHKAGEAQALLQKFYLKPQKHSQADRTLSPPLGHPFRDRMC